MSGETSCTPPEGSPGAHIGRLTVATPKGGVGAYPPLHTPVRLPDSAWPHHGVQSLPHGSAPRERHCSGSGNKSGSVRQGGWWGTHDQHPPGLLSSLPLPLPFLSLSVSPFLSLSVSVSAYQSLSLLVSCLSLSVFQAVSFCFPFSFHLPLCPSPSQFLSLCLCLHSLLSVFLSLCLSWP